MASPLIKRLERLQEALAAQLNKPVASVFLPFDPDATAEQYDAIAEQEIDNLVNTGEIGENQCHRVMCMRWMTAEENADYVQQQLDGPVPEPKKGKAPDVPQDDVRHISDEAPVSS
jgi:hypothetical protein